MNERDPERYEATKRLRRYLTSFGYKHFRGPNAQQHIFFFGRLREWLLVTTLTPDWFHASTVVCALPTEAGVRADLLTWMARANGRLALLKYSLTPYDAVIVEAEIRAEKLDANDVGTLVAYVRETAERDYPDVFRIASGTARLDRLSAAFSLEPTATQEVRVDER